MNQPKPGVSVVVPVYNGSRSLPELAERVGKVMGDTREPFELLLIDDGSRDDTWSVILQLSAKHEWVRGVSLMRNYGQHNALLCGIRTARYEIILTMDADLQHPPEEIPPLLEALVPGVDVVYGTPTRQRHPLGHILAARLLKLSLAAALGAKTARIVSPFRAFRTRLRSAFEGCSSPWVIIDIYLTWATDKFKEVKFHHEPRTLGTSYTWRGRFDQALDMITGFSTLPLRFATWVGFFFTFFGICVFLYVLSVYIFQGGTVPGFAFLASTIAIFSGAQLFALGILGEYLARMFQRSMERPPYAVVETTDLSRDRSTLTSQRGVSD